MALWMWLLHPSMSFLAIICCAASTSFKVVVLASPSYENRGGTCRSFRCRVTQARYLHRCERVHTALPGSQCPVLRTPQSTVSAYGPGVFQGRFFCSDEQQEPDRRGFPKQKP